jgi:hypothetical protein
VYCAYCSEKIRGDAIKQGNDYFCSVECANEAAGIDPEDPVLYETGEYDEDFLEEEDFS